MVWSVITDIAAVITLLGLPYLVVNYRRRAPRFSFAFKGSSRQEFDRDGLRFCRFQFQGSIRNESLDPNSIEQINLVVWETKRKRGTRTFGYIPTQITEGDERHTLPLRFDARHGRDLTVTFEVPLTGTHEVELVRAVEPVPAGTPGVRPGQTFYMPKYIYELAFEDITGNLFDQGGLLRNKKGIQLRWTLENTFKQLKDGNPLPFIKHLLSIVVTDAVFSVRRNLRRLGI